jgi:hypothetical protein
MALNISSFFTQSSDKQNRRIFIGPVPLFTWVVPEGTTEVEVNVWGGGGGGGIGQPYITNPLFAAGGGGGGGGFARHLYKVTGGDVLQIAVGGQGGTSSVSCPTIVGASQPISATGGTPGLAVLGGNGGSGSVSSVPIPLRTGITTSFSGGAGGSGGPGSHAGSGGGGGFIFTNGENGLSGSPIPAPQSVRGGYSCPLLYTGYQTNDTFGSISRKPFFNSLTNAFSEEQTINENKSKWFYLEEFVTNLIDSYGRNNLYVTDVAYGSILNNQIYPSRNKFLGGGRGEGLYSSGGPPVDYLKQYPISFWTPSSYVAGGAGGGGLFGTPGSFPTYTAHSSGGSGGVGAVIIYW